MKLQFLFILTILTFGFNFSYLKDELSDNKKTNANIFAEKESSNYLYANIKDTSEELPINNGLTDIANMFNERGYYKSNDFSLNEQEIINNLNGNLLYNIPLYNYKLAGDFDLNLSLNYNGTVGHQIFLGDVTSYNNGASERLNYNCPEWIISLNGIAVHALNYEASFFTNQVEAAQIVGDNINSLIPGYHFDGSLLAAEGQNPSYNSGESIYKFTSKERDKETSYDYFGARYYDARVGRWRSEDPMLEKHYDDKFYELSKKYKPFLNCIIKIYQGDRPLINLKREFLKDFVNLNTEIMFDIYNYD